MARVLILEQSKSVRNNLRERLEFEGYSTESTDRADEAARLCAQIPFDVIISDNAAAIAGAGIPFIVLSADNSVASAVDALHHGAEDFITKPVDMNRLLGAMRRAVAPEERDGEPSTAENTGTLHTSHTARSRHKTRRTASATATQGDGTIIGTSAAIRRVIDIVDRVARSEARVLITGENGTGKELVARSLHAKSARAAAPFVEVNCAAIPSELIESELFGHERGAFTSAVRSRKGKFEQADGGTLFMDEIGDMSLSAQAKVLRALQENRISRVGSDRDIDVDVRVVAATNKDLREQIRLGNFREDLYHRLGVIVIKVPPLRERTGDIPLLADYFLGQVCAENGIPKKGIDADALATLQHMPWSGNIRELRNVVERLVVLSEGSITLADVEEFCVV